MREVPPGKYLKSEGTECGDCCDSLGEEVDPYTKCMSKARMCIEMINGCASYDESGIMKCAVRSGST